MLLLEGLNLLVRQMPVCSAKLEDSTSQPIKNTDKDQRHGGGESQ